jgi:hypothetical protein
LSYAIKAKKKVAFPRGSLIGCEPCLIKRRSQIRIPPPPTLVWTSLKKKVAKIAKYNYFSDFSYTAGDALNGDMDFKIIIGYGIYHY